jgi:glycine/D-amino acid oxidase-like deaminating enzyme
MSAPRPTVAVLGAGIMGAATALFLARAGARVVLFDEADVPLAGASRWNEGKIHLGHLYSADPGLHTARRVLPGGLAFRALAEELVGTPLQGVTDHDDTYLVHRDSVVDAAAMGRYLDAATTLAAEHPQAGDYLVDLRRARARALSAVELGAIADPARVVAGFRVPERSLDTLWLADRLAAALHAEPGIELRLGTRVEALHRDGEHAPLQVRTAAGVDGPFAFVVNALWHGRLAVDATLGLPLPAERNHRYRLSVFLRAPAQPQLASCVVATGPFGDFKNYGGGRYYLSWYPEGLVAEGSGVAPPAVAPLDAAARADIGRRIRARLAATVPALATLAGDDARVEGGWVYAEGSGSLADRAATLHRRDRAGVQRSGNLFSVDTGKYSIAPWLARGIADEILGR